VRERVGGCWIWDSVRRVFPPCSNFVGKAMGCHCWVVVSGEGGRGDEESIRLAAATAREAVADRKGKKLMHSASFVLRGHVLSLLSSSLGLKLRFDMHFAMHADRLTINAAICGYRLPLLIRRAQAREDPFPVMFDRPRGGRRGEPVPEPCPICLVRERKRKAIGLLFAA
jgi:hypothetical protein